MKLEYQIQKEDPYLEIKDVLKQEFKLSSRLATKVKKENAIYLNGTPSFNYACVQETDIVTVFLDYEEENETILPTKMDLSIIYEDEAYLILNKKPFMPTHPSMSHYQNSLANGVRYYFDSIGLKKKIRPVNRLDKNTSGIIIFAKNAYIQEDLSRQMQTGSFQKEYVAILEGNVTPTSGTIEASIARKKDSIIERCIDPDGEHAISHYMVQKTKDNLSLVQFHIETGKTHQIRLHAQYLGFPILGDTLYGNPSSLITRQALHSRKVSFIHPISKKPVSYEADLPEDMKYLFP